MFNMKKYEERLKISRETGKGFVKRFQEKSTYVEAVNGYDCPYCGAKHGYSSQSKPKTVNHDVYETPHDIEFYCNDTGYSWTEDCKCGNCGGMYSQNNGC